MSELTGEKFDKDSGGYTGCGLAAMMFLMLVASNLGYNAGRNVANAEVEVLRREVQSLANDVDGLRESHSRLAKTVADRWEERLDAIDKKLSKYRNRAHALSTIRGVNDDGY